MSVQPCNLPWAVRVVGDEYEILTPAVLFEYEAPFYVSLEPRFATAEEAHQVIREYSP